MIEKIVVKRGEKPIRVPLTAAEIADMEDERLSWEAAAPEREKTALQQELSATDKDMARIAEDVIALLVSKGVILESELPVKAQEKINQRNILRAKIEELK